MLERGEGRLLQVAVDEVVEAGEAVEGEEAAAVEEETVEVKKEEAVVEKEEEEEGDDDVVYGVEEVVEVEDEDG